MSERKILSSILCACILAASSITHAGEDSTITQRLPVKLDEAIDVALHNRVDIAIVSQQSSSATSKVNVARGYFLPQISLSGSSKRTNYIDKFTGIEANASLGDQTYHVSVQKDNPSYESNAGLDLTYNIYSGGRDTAVLEAAIAEQTALKHQETATKQKVSLEVMNAYWLLRKSQVLSRIAERASLHAKKLLLVSQAKKASYLISEIDAESEALSVKEAELAVADAGRDKERNLNKFRESLGISDSSPRAQVAESVSLSDDPDMVSCEDLRPASDRPETLMLKSEVIAAENRVKGAEAAYLPKIDLITNYRVVGRDNDDYFKSTQLRSDDYMVGVTFSFTLFDGFKDRIALAKSEEEIARLRIVQNIKQLDAQDNEKIVAKERLQKEVELATQRLKLYELKKQLAQEKYRNGKIAKIDLLEAEKNYEDFADKLLISKIDAAIALQSISMNNRIY
jgi:outer membrane protein TolC